MCGSYAAVCMCELVLCIICISTSHHVAKTTSSVHLGGQEIKRWCKCSETETRAKIHTHTHSHTGSINNSGYKLSISISRFLSSSQIPGLSITWNIFYWPLMSHTHRGRTYRLARPWTGAVDGVLADDTVWFVRRQPGHNHATRRGGDCLDASWWTRNYREHTGTSAKRACWVLGAY